MIKEVILLKKYLVCPNLDPPSTIIPMIESKRVSLILKTDDYWTAMAFL